MGGARTEPVKKPGHEEEGVERKEEEEDSSKVIKEEEGEEGGASEGTADRQVPRKILMVQTANLTHAPFEKTSEMKVRGGVREMKVRGGVREGT